MEGQNQVNGIRLEETKCMEDLTSFQVVDFGSVQPGQTYTKQVKLSIAYEPVDITSTRLQSPLDKIITVEYKPNNTFQFTYKPSLPGHTTVDVFYIKFENKSQTALIARGTTKRPCSILSKSQLSFMTSDQHPVAEFVIYLENVSDVTDYFQWDVPDQSNSVIVEPTLGKLRPMDKIRIRIRVSSGHKGLFWRQIFCLMKFQEPLVLVITGVHTNDPVKPDLSRVIQLNETLPVCQTEFCRFMGDCWRLIFTDSRPLLTISHRYLHFGDVRFGEGYKTNARAFTVTNHALKALTVAWEKDKLGVFVIEPEFSTIKSNESVTFVAKFTPNRPNEFYCTDLIANVLWGSKLDFLVPVSLAVGLAGNSFSTHGCGWKFSYKLDRTLIVLPGTVPGVPVYTTFKLIKQSGPAVFFRLYPADPKTPPELSAFVVKPAQGLVTDDFQLIVVQMYSGDLPDVEIIEEWIMCINNLVKVKLTFCGTCQLPYVLIGRNKLVEFPPTTIGVLSSLLVPIRNTTRLHLKCKALTEPESPEFELGPGEQATISVSFYPKTGPQEFNWAVPVDVVWHHGDKNIEKILRGQLITAQTVVRCFGRSVVAMLEGNPQWTTMNVIIMQACATSLKIQNNGEGVLYLVLTLKPGTFGTENATIAINPAELIVKPLESRQVTVNILTRNVGRNCFQIVGTFYESDKFKEKKSTELPLVFIELFSSFPSLKVIDIQYDGLINNVSKLTLWSLLRINHLNDTLKNVSSMAAQTCCMHLPSSAQHSDSFRFHLLLQSTTEVPLIMSIKRVKSCKCEAVRGGTISRRLQVSTCPHNSEIIATLSKNKLKPCEKAVLTFDTKYNEPQAEPFKFILTIGTGEPSNLKTKVTLQLMRPVTMAFVPRLDLSIPPSVPPFILDCQRKNSGIFYTWLLEPLCINEASKYVQILWLWNESLFDVNYFVEWKCVDPKVFHLLNPSGTVEASGNRPLLLMCSPCEFKDYSAEMIIKSQDSAESILVRVELKVPTNAKYDSREMLKKMSQKNLFDQTELSLSLSEDHMCLEPLPTHSNTRRIFFIKNNSTHTLKFEWLECKIWSILEAMVSPPVGVLRPQEICACMVQIRSFRFPTKCSFSLSCRVINLTKCKVYWASSNINKRASIAFDASFTLTDSSVAIGGKSFHAADAGVQMPEKPQTRLLSLGISVHIFSGDQIDFICPPAKKQLQFAPNMKAEITSPPENVLRINSPQVPDIILDVMRTVVSQIIKSAPFKLTHKIKIPVVKYASSCRLDVPDFPKTLQGYYMSSLMSRAVFASVTDMFGLPSVVNVENADKRIEVPGLCRPPHLNNSYYQGILEREFCQVQGLVKICNAKTKSEASRKIDDSSTVE